MKDKPSCPTHGVKFIHRTFKNKFIERYECFLQSGTCGFKKDIEINPTSFNSTEEWNIL